MKSYEFLLENEELDNQQPDEKDPVESAINEFKSTAANLGKDLYSLTPWDYLEYFAGSDASPDSSVLSAIKKVAVLTPENQNVYHAFRTYGGNDIGQNRIVSNIILNTRNGNIIHFLADPTEDSSLNGVDANDLASNGIIDDDQVGTLTKILAAGGGYVLAVGSDADWQPGTSTPAIDKAQSKLFSALHLSSQKFSDPKYSDDEKERRARAKEKLKNYWAKKKEQGKTDTIKKRHGK